MESYYQQSNVAEVTLSYKEFTEQTARIFEQCNELINLNKNKCVLIVPQISDASESYTEALRKI